MASDEIARAAERLRRIGKTRDFEALKSVYLTAEDAKPEANYHKNPCFGESLCLTRLEADHETLADAYLAERDDQPITEDFLSEKLKRNTDSGNWRIYRSTPLSIEVEHSGGGFWLWICDDRVSPVPVKQLKTRGDLLRLLDALGLSPEGKGKPNGKA